MDQDNSPETIQPSRALTSYTLQPAAPVYHPAVRKPAPQIPNLEFPVFLQSAASHPLQTRITLQRAFSIDTPLEPRLYVKAVEVWDLIQRMPIERLQEKYIISEIYTVVTSSQGIERRPKFASDRVSEILFYLRFERLFTQHKFKIEDDETLRSKDAIQSINQPQLFQKAEFLYIDPLGGLQQPLRYRVYFNINREKINDILHELSTFLNQPENHRMQCKVALQKRFKQKMIMRHDKLLCYCDNLQQARALCEHFSGKQLTLETMDLATSVLPDIALQGYGIALEVWMDLPREPYLKETFSWNQLLAAILFNCFVFSKYYAHQSHSLDQFIALLKLVIVRLNINPSMLYRQILPTEPQPEMPPETTQPVNNGLQDTKL